jgi:hypothetical protein
MVNLRNGTFHVFFMKFLSLLHVDKYDDEAIEKNQESNLYGIINKKGLQDEREDVIGQTVFFSGWKDSSSFKNLIPGRGRLSHIHT